MESETAVTFDGFGLSVEVDGIPKTILEVEGWKSIVPDEGKNFALRVNNSTDRPVLVQIFVDGISVMGGDRYILAPHQQTICRGFAKDQETVTRFVFGRAQAITGRHAQLSTCQHDIGLIRAVFYATEAAGPRAQPVSGPFTGAAPVKACTVDQDNLKKTNALILEGERIRDPTYYSETQYRTLARLAELEIRYNVVAAPTRALANDQGDADAAGY
ncbi:hypothetical protein PAPYR_1286 [Paratrimastix pyriformis]|uniref:Uncharacterized protein n=1 Tax=Paratrimastix pyriformis TaxID=342808 RepID=A0ABQ8UUR5_9EUKA|nr:hypothetical protein PAPYR_1286 [Paratrimastix pyriformis]